MDEFQKTILRIYQNQNIDSSEVNVQNTVGGGGKFVSYEGKDSYSFFLRRDDGHLVLSSPEGKPSSIIIIAEQIAAGEKSKLAIGTGDLDLNFISSLVNKGYKLKGGVYQKG